MLRWNCLRRSKVNRYIVLFHQYAYAWVNISWSTFHMIFSKKKIHHAKIMFLVSIVLTFQLQRYLNAAHCCFYLAWFKSAFFKYNCFCFLGNRSKNPYGIYRVTKKYLWHAALKWGNKQFEIPDYVDLIIQCIQYCVIFIARVVFICAALSVKRYYLSYCCSPLKQ